MSSVFTVLRRAFTNHASSNEESVSRSEPASVSSYTAERAEEPLDRRPSVKAGEPGMRVLHDHRDAEVDIIFVHGLRGGREKTWASRRRDGSYCLWPKDLLPIDLPRARIVTWGYDADVIHGGAIGCNNISGHAHALCVDIADLRMQTRKDRPIIFVAHGLGGIVCKEALLHSFHSPSGDASHIRQVVTSTLGVIFLDTPHLGSAQDQLEAIIKSVLGSSKPVNTASIMSLVNGNPSLESTNDDIVSLLRGRSEHNHPLYATCFSGEGTIRSLGTMPHKQSALTSGHECFSLPGDHLEIARYRSRFDTGYQRIVAEISRWLDLHNESELKRIAAKK